MTPTGPKTVNGRTVKQPLTDAEMRLLYAEATRVKNGEVREVRVERSGRGLRVVPLSRAA